MGRTIGADQTGSIDRETHRQFLNGDIVHDLIVAALQKGRVDRGEGFVALGGQPGPAAAERSPLLVAAGVIRLVGVLAAALAAGGATL